MSHHTAMLIESVVLAIVFGAFWIGLITGVNYWSRRRARKKGKK